MNSGRENIKGKVDYESQLQDVTSKKARILKMMKRGEKSIVLEYGSHTLKYGFANDSEPQIIRMLIAREKIEREKLGLKNHESRDSRISEDQQSLAQLYGNSDLVEQELRKAGHIKNSDLKMKLELKENSFTAGMKLRKEKLVLTELRRDEELKDIYIGEKIFFIEGRDDYVTRQPLKYGCFNLKKDYDERQVISDLELITKKALFNLGFDSPLEKYLQDFSVIISAPDKFSRRQYKFIIDMLMKNLGFGKFYIHLQSVLSTFSAGVSTSCVVDLGYNSITVCSIVDGVVVEDSIVKKSFGGADLDLVLKLLSEKNKTIKLLPPGTNFQEERFKTMGYFEKLREKFGILVSDDDLELQIDTDFPAELQEPTKIISSFNMSFVLTPSSLFYSSIFNTLKKGKFIRNELNSESEYFKDYLDEDDYDMDTKEAAIDKLLTSSKNIAFNSQKKEVLEKINMNESDILDPFTMITLEDLISYSIFQIKDIEGRKRAAMNVVLTGGLARTVCLVDMVEFKLSERINLYDPNIIKVEVKTGESRKIDLRYLSWIGGTIIPKLDCMRKLFVSRERWTGYIDTEHVNNIFGIEESWKNEDDNDTVKTGEEKKKVRTPDFVNPYGYSDLVSPEFGIKYLKEKIAFKW